MYNLNLLENEDVKVIIDDVIISQDNNSKTTTVALTNQRLLFLDNFNDISETLRISRAVDYLKEKEIYYIINITDITSINDNTITLKDNTILTIHDDIIIKNLKQTLL